MSDDGIKRDWQQTLDTVEQRDQHILDNDQWTDFTFIVGEPGHEKKFRVHRLHLAKTSPVFATMLYGTMKSKTDEERVTDIDPEVFEVLLQYIYKGTIVLEDYDLALGLLYAASKYMMPDSLLLKCREYVEKNLKPETVWSALDFALHNVDETSMRKNSFQMIEAKTEETLKMPGFLEVSSRSILKLVQSKALTLTSEFKLYEAIVCWARKKGSIIPNSDNELRTLRSILDPILPHVRFLAMTNDEFWKCADLENILNDTEILQLAKCINSFNNSSSPEGFSSMKEKRKYLCNPAILAQDGNTFYVQSTPPSEVASVTNWDEYEFCKYAYVRIPENSNTVLRTMNIPTQIRPADCKSDQYAENITLLVHNKLTGKTNQFIWTQVFQYGITVPWSLAQFGYGNKIFTEELEIRIVFHLSGKYPCNNYMAQNDANEDVPCRFLQMQ